MGGRGNGSATLGPPSDPKLSHIDRVGGSSYNPGTLEEQVALGWILTRREAEVSYEYLFEVSDKFRSGWLVSVFSHDHGTRSTSCGLFFIFRCFYEFLYRHKRPDVYIQGKEII